MQFKAKSILDYLLTITLLVLAVKVLFSMIIGDSTLGEIYRWFGAARISSGGSSSVGFATVLIKSIAIGFFALISIAYGHRNKKAITYWLKILAVAIILWGLPTF